MKRASVSSSSSSACSVAAWNLCMDVLCSPRLPPKGMMGTYGSPYMPMQGPHEGLLSVAQMPPHPAGLPHLPPHHLHQGMPGYPGMPHQGKGHRPSHTCSVSSSLVSPAGGVYLVHRLHSLSYSLSSPSYLVSNRSFTANIQTHCHTCNACGN